MNEAFYDRLRATLKYPETRDEIVAFFEKHYPGQKVDKKGKITEEWKGKLADRLASFTRDKNGQPMSKKNVMRRFQNRQGKRWQDTPPSDRQKAEYKALGKTLPPIIPPGGFHVWGKGKIKYSKKCETVKIDEYITGKAAEFLAKTGDVQVVLNSYNELAADDPDAPQECLDQKSDLQIEAIY